MKQKSKYESNIALVIDVTLIIVLVLIFIYLTRQIPEQARAEQTTNNINKKQPEKTPSIPAKNQEPYCPPTNSTKTPLRGLSYV